jgi:hypothetical protein
MHQWAERWIDRVQGWPDLDLGGEEQQAVVQLIRAALADAPPHLTATH